MRGAVHVCSRKLSLRTSAARRCPRGGAARRAGGEGTRYAPYLASGLPGAAALKSCRKYLRGHTGTGSQLRGLNKSATIQQAYFGVSISPHNGQTREHKCKVGTKRSQAHPTRSLGSGCARGRSKAVRYGLNVATCTSGPLGDRVAS